MFACPFGCYGLVNKNEDLTKINKLTEKYFDKCPICVYDCPIPPSLQDISCKDNKCIDLRFQLEKS